MGLGFGNIVDLLMCDDVPNKSLLDVDLLTRIFLSWKIYIYLANSSELMITRNYLECRRKKVWIKLVGSSHNVVNTNLKRSQKGLWSVLHSAHADVSVFYLTTGALQAFCHSKRQNQHLVDHSYVLHVAKNLLFTFVIFWPMQMWYTMFLCEKWPSEGTLSLNDH